MFIEENEHVIIMENTIHYPFSLDDLKKLEDAGVKTVFLTSVIRWDDIYSHNDWSCIDSRIEKFSKTNLKLIIPFHGKNLPEKFQWKDKDDWLKERPDYVAWQDYYPGHIPDYENKEYQDAVDDFAHGAIQKYSSWHNSIQFIYAIPDDGEFPWFPHWPTYPIPSYILIDFIIERQLLLQQQYDEVWTCFHNQTGLWNAENIMEVYRAERDFFPDVPRYAVQFEHFIHGINSQLFVKKYTEEYGVRFFVGSNYVEGLKDNLQRGIDQKIWGFLTAPMHYLNSTHHTKVEDWMIPVIQKANQRLCEVWNDCN